ncbi:MAG: phosphogluconate dehydrogenase (NAD(+)-dependent, decarboxylating) [Chloroflexota bacterium]
MEIAMVGLGKMGANMVQRLLQGGHRVVVSDINKEAVATAVSHGAVGSESIADMVSKLANPSVVWVMVPSGKITESVINQVAEHLSEGDILIDGGNSNYKDTMRRSEELAAKGLLMVDVGTSGGVWGLAEGYSMMVGGSDKAVTAVTPALKTLAPGEDQGWGHVGPNGSGHYVKMVHNGIEYGLMQAYAEGFDIMRAKKGFDFDLHQIAEIWRHGSVVRSWLLDLTANALSEDPEFTDIEGYVPDSGEGRWTIFDSIDLDVPAPVLTLALQMRFISRDDEQYWAKMLSAMRNQFGGHAIKKAVKE